MNFEKHDADDRDARLERVLANVVHAAEAGTSIDQQQLIDEHPDLADELRSFFAKRTPRRR